MKSPLRKRTFLILAAAVLLLIPVAKVATDVLYMSLPHDSNADSPGVAIMQLTQLVIMVAIFSPFFALFVWFVWRRYIGAQPLWSFRRERPFFSSALWLVFGTFVALNLMSVFFVRRPSDIPWAAHGLLTFFLLSCNGALLAAYVRPANA